MDWDNAMRNMIVSVVQEQLAPIEKRLNNLAIDAGDIWQAIGDAEPGISLCQAVDSHTGSLADIQKRIAALEFVRVPITEVEPQDLDEAMRERVQPLRDDLDDLTDKFREFEHATNARLDELEEDSQVNNVDINRVVEIATVDLHGRLSTLEGHHAAKAPANDPEPIENICAALEAEYVAHGVSMMAGGASAGHTKAQMHNRHLTHALGALQRAQKKIDGLAAGMGEQEAA